MLGDRAQQGTHHRMGQSGSVRRACCVGRVGAMVAHKTVDVYNNKKAA
jgi:hypothetical protein